MEHIRNPRAERQRHYYLARHLERIDLGHMPPRIRWDPRPSRCACNRHPTARPKMCSLLESNTTGSVTDLTSRLASSGTSKAYTEVGPGVGLPHV
jgi:hypothetical protein